MKIEMSQTVTFARFGDNLCSKSGKKKKKKKILGFSTKFCSLLDLVNAWFLKLVTKLPFILTSKKFEIL